MKKSKIWLLCIIYTPIYRLTEIKKTFPCTKLFTWNGGSKIWLNARAPRPRQGSC